MTEDTGEALAGSTVGVVGYKIYRSVKIRVELYQNIKRQLDDTNEDS